MRSSCSVTCEPLWATALAVFVLAGVPQNGAIGQTDPFAPTTPDIILRFDRGGARVDVMPTDIAAIEISESGGITDLFLRFSPTLAADLAALTERPDAQDLRLTICDRNVAFVDAPLPNTRGTVYIAGRTAPEAEALRALWSGRSTCATLSPEIFAHAP